MYNTNIGDFNKYHLEKLSDKKLISYAKLLIKDASEKERERNENKKWATSYMYSSAVSKVSAVLAELSERGLIEINSYEYKKINEFLKLFR